MTVEATATIDKIARAICQERCAFYGEPACWTFNNEPGTPWPNPNCDEPGCFALAKAVFEELRVRG